MLFTTYQLTSQIDSYTFMLPLCQSYIKQWIRLLILNIILNHHITKNMRISCILFVMIVTYCSQTIDLKSSVIYNPSIDETYNIVKQNIYPQQKFTTKVPKNYYVKKLGQSNINKKKPAHSQSNKNAGYTISSTNITFDNDKYKNIQILPKVNQFDVIAEYSATKSVYSNAPSPTQSPSVQSPSNSDTALIASAGNEKQKETNNIQSQLQLNNLSQQPAKVPNPQLNIIPKGDDTSLTAQQKQINKQRYEKHHQSLVVIVSLVILLLIIFVVIQCRKKRTSDAWQSIEKRFGKQSSTSIEVMDEDEFNLYNDSQLMQNEQDY